jgi:hypothetical protein
LAKTAADVSHRYSQAVIFGKDDRYGMADSRIGVARLHRTGAAQ